MPKAETEELTKHTMHLYSGDYERLTRGSSLSGNRHHILDPRTGTSARAAASATVVACGAMLADSLAMASFVLGTVVAIPRLNRVGLDVIMVNAVFEL